MDYDINKEIQVVEVVISRQTRRGTGTPESPVRIITQIFTKSGELIAEHDALKTHLQTNTD